jgi:hypothetical protein
VSVVDRDAVQAKKPILSPETCVSYTILRSAVKDNTMTFIRAKFLFSSSPLPLSKPPS